MIGGYTLTVSGYTYSPNYDKNGSSWQGWNWGHVSKTLWWAVGMGNKPNWNSNFTETTHFCTRTFMYCFLIVVSQVKVDASFAVAQNVMDKKQVGGMFGEWIWSFQHALNKQKNEPMLMQIFCVKNI